MSAFRKNTVLQLEHNCIKVMHKFFMPDGHRCISGFKRNKNVHYYMLVSIFCFALLTLFLNLPYVIMLKSVAFMEPSLSWFLCLTHTVKPKWVSNVSSMSSMFQLKEKQ